MSAFRNYHLAITKAEYQARSYPALTGGLWLAEIAPTYDTFYALLKRVGGPWGWDRRPRYHDNQAMWEGRLQAPETRLHLFGHQDQVLGYCLAGTVKQDLSDIFTESATGASVIEIENFGLFPEHTGKRYGQTFLPAVFSHLFQDYDAVYLTTRSTNHGKVVPFYQGLGMSVIHTEILPDDLAPVPARPAVLALAKR